MKLVIIFTIPKYVLPPPLSRGATAVDGILPCCYVLVVLGMRVALLKRRLSSIGGSEKYAKAVLSALRERGVEPVLYCIEGKGVPEGTTLCPLSIPQVGKTLELLLYNRRVQSALSRSQGFRAVLSFDKTLIHTHLRLGGGLHRAWLRRKERITPRWARPLIWSHPYHRAVLEIERRGLTCHALEKVIANSEMVRREVLEIYDLDPLKVVVIHNGVEWHQLEEPFLNAPMARRDWGLPLDPKGFTFLFVGNGFRRKGLAQAILALEKLPKEVNLLVVGKDGQLPRYRALVEAKGLGGRVFFAGEQPDPMRFYQLADAFVLPTLYDPFSNATLEALAMGLYVVTTRDNGCSEVIKDFAGTIIEDPLDLDSVAHAMEKALYAPKDRGKIRASVSHLTLGSQVSKLLDLCLKAA